MRLVAYLRVSTDRQAEQGFGLDVQEHAIMKWAELNGHELVALTKDAGLSGTRDATDRPGLSDALNLIERGEAPGLVVARLDRLARSLTIQEGTLGHVWMQGGMVFTVDGGEVLTDDPDDPMRAAMRQMAGVFSQLERGMIARRMRDGRRRKHEQGGFAFGSPPFGWKAEAKRLVPVPEEQDALALMRRLRGEGISLRRIAAALEREGFRPRRASSWHSHSVGRILGRLEQVECGGPSSLNPAMALVCASPPTCLRCEQGAHRENGRERRQVYLQAGGDAVAHRPLRRAVARSR